MKSFQELDNLLQTAYDDLNKEEENDAYLSSERILKDITNSDKSLVDLSNLKRLEEKLQLTSLETNIILILFALEVDPRYERIFAYIQDNMNMTYVTVELLNKLFCSIKDETEALYAYFAMPFKLSMLDMISFSSSDTSSDIIFKKPILLSPSVRNYLLGDVHLQGTLARYCTIIEPYQEPSVSLSGVEKSIEENVDKATNTSERYLINIYGKSEKMKKDEAVKIASSFYVGLLCVDTKAAIKTEESFEKIVPSLLRDALLTGTLLYFESFEYCLESEKSNELEVISILEQLSWMTFFSSKKSWNPAKIPNAVNFYSFEHVNDDPNYTKHYWEEALSRYDSSMASDLSQTLSHTFDFLEEEIDAIVAYLDTQKKLGKTIDKEHTLRACRSKITADLGKYAQHIKASGTFEDLVLSQKQSEKLQEIVIHHKYQDKIFQEWGFDAFFQSRGIGVLLSGPSGTGKTMTASILANTLGLELYKIDLSKMISKYVGETEKQLSELFDTAKKTGTMLFFDEADSVFGKRSAVQDAHDRYANIEVSYLLQKIEEYEGIVILASNFKENIDEAFLRRFRFTVEFSMPNVEQRELLWTKFFSEDILAKPISFEMHAKRFKLSGANIRNIALYAAFNAAADESKISIIHIVKALKGELNKIGNGYTEDDFRELC